MKYVVLIIGCITQVSPGSLNPFSLWYLSSDNKEYFCLLWLSQNLQPFVPACLIQVFSWQISPTSPFSFYFGFLDHCLPFRKVLGLPCCHCVGHLPWKYWAQGAKGAGFHCCPSGPTPRCGNVLCSRMEPKATSFVTWGASWPSDCRNFGVLASLCFSHDFFLLQYLLIEHLLYTRHCDRHDMCYYDTVQI